MNAFPPEVIETLKWYVYLYFDPLEDPHNRRPFYVGKGEGNRAFAHLADTSESEKVKRIAEIRAAGKKPKIEILRYGLTEDQAFLVEAAVIDCIGLDHLTNDVSGHHSDSFGRVKVEEVTDQWSAPKANIQEPSILITINKLYRSDMTPTELNEATRGIWKVGPRRESAEFAMAVFQGVIRQVYKIKKPWLRAGKLQYHTRDTTGFARSGRWEFDGEVAPERLRKKYVGKSVRHVLGHGSQNPIHYVKC
jgi:hypothetical protein